MLRLHLPQPCFPRKAFRTVSLDERPSKGALAVSGLRDVGPNHASSTTSTGLPDGEAEPIRPGPRYLGLMKVRVSWDRTAVAGVKQGLLAEAERAAIEELEARFVDRGWRLAFERETGGTWTAFFYPRIEGVGTAAREVSAPTKLDAARAAWDTFTRAS